MEITSIANQTVLAGNNILFTETPVPGNKCIKHRDGSGLVTLRGITNNCFARYLVAFNGDIAANASAGAISVAISLEGESLGAATMTVTPGATGAFFNVASQIYIDVPKGCCMTISAKNVSGQSIVVRNANLTASRVA